MSTEPSEAAKQVAGKIRQAIANGVAPQYTAMQIQEFANAEVAKLRGELEQTRRDKENVYFSLSAAEEKLYDMRAEVAKLRERLREVLVKAWKDYSDP